MQSRLLIDGKLVDGEGDALDNIDAATHTPMSMAHKTSVDKDRSFCMLAAYTSIRHVMIAH